MNLPTCSQNFNLKLRRKNPFFLTGKASEKIDFATIPLAIGPIVCKGYRCLSNFDALKIFSLFSLITFEREILGTPEIGT